MHRATAVLAAACFSAGAFSAAAVAQPTFEWLPSTLTGPPMRALARGVSGDGEVIAGSTDTFVNEKPVVWRKVEGAWTLALLPAEGPQLLGRGVSLSHDGDVIGGMTNIYTGGTAVYGTPAVWRGVRSGLPVIDTPMDTPQQRRGIFSGMSADGLTLRGYASLVPPSSAREIWSYGPGGLSQLSPPGLTSYATAYMFGGSVSGDGEVLAGSRMDFDRRLAVRWTAATGFVDLATPTTGFRHSMAEVVSRDGRVIGGCLTLNPQVYNGEARPVLWTESGRTDLPTAAPLGPYGRVMALSGDGRLAGGVQHLTTLMLDGPSHFAEHAVMWMDGQLHGLSAYLSARGVNMTGIQPHWITGISDDGRVLVGFASQQGDFGLKSFIVTLPGPCAIDFNDDGMVDFADYLEFLNLYDAQDDRADLTDDGLIDFADYLEFLNLYEAGC